MIPNNWTITFLRKDGIWKAWADKPMDNGKFSIAMCAEGFPTYEEAYAWLRSETGK